jgi:hypothetical protein
MVMPLAIGAGVQLLGGLFGSRSKRKAAARAQAQAAAEAARLQAYGRGAVDRHSGMMQEQRGINFRPVNISTGMGTHKFGPDGSVEAQLSQPLQQQQDWMYGQADNLRGQMGNLDRDAFAQQDYQRMQALMGEGRNAAMSGTMGMLSRKGLAGFGMDAGTGGGSTNPIMSSLMDRFNRQDQEMAYNSYGRADNEMKRLMDMQRQMFGGGAEINNMLNPQLMQSMQFGQQNFQNDRSMFNDRYSMFQNKELMQKIAELGGMEGISAANTAANQARLGQSTGFWGGVSNLGAGMMGGGNLGGMFGGMFGGGGMDTTDYGLRMGAAYPNSI